MTDDQPLITATRVIYRGWTTFGVVTLPERDGRLVDRVFEDHGAACCVLPYDPHRKVALVVRQKRVGPLLTGVAEELIEPPAGGLGDEDPATAAVREAMEEVGVRLGDLESIGSPFAMPSISTERLHLFLAPYAMGDRIAAGGGLAEEHEHLEVAEIGLAELSEMARRGTLHDMKMLVLVQALQLRRPHLFSAEAPPTPSRSV